MKKIELKQNTPEWLATRRSCIGSSDIPVLMGVCASYIKNNTPRKLYDKKLSNEEDFVNIYMQYGNEQEPIARSWIAEKIGFFLESACYVHPDCKGFLASVDAINEEEKVVYEIKTSQNPEILESLEKKIIPQYWEYQLQWQLYVTGLQKGYIAFWNGNEAQFFEIVADPHLHNEMKKEATAFYLCLQLQKRPEAWPQDRIEIEEKEANDAIDEYVRVYNEIKSITDSKEVKELEKELKICKERVLDFCPEDDCLLNGIQINYQSSVSFDEKKMIEDGIEPSKYKKYSYYSQIYLPKELKNKWKLLKQSVA